MKQISLVLLIGASLLFNSCKKDDDPTKKEMLVGKNWVMTGLTVDPAFPVIGANVYNQLRACDKDDITKFSADGKATFDEGASKCNLADPQTTTGTWALNTTETILSITDGTTNSVTIKTLTSGKMVGTFQEVEGGVTYTYEVTYEAK